MAGPARQAAHGLGYPFGVPTSNQEHMLPADDVWDAGNMGCGELVIELRSRLKRMPGRVLRVVALDAGADADIPAWCRMTRTPLLGQDPATCSFWVRSRDDWA